jgi:hypothetical protein
MKTRTAPASPTDELDTVPDTSSPAYASRHPLTRAFDKFASLVTRWAGSPAAFCMAADRCRVGNHGTDISLLGRVATGYQYRHDYRDVPHGFPDSAEPEQR